MLFVILIFPVIFTIRGLYPAVLFKVYALFPYQVFGIKDHPYFITSDAKGVIAMKNQLFYTPKTSESIDEKTDAELQELYEFLGLSKGKKQTTSTRDEVIRLIAEYYADPGWNPFNLHPAGRDSFPKFMLHFCVVIALWTYQIFVLICFAIWPFLLALRLPFVLVLIVFLAITKVMFFKRPWNLLVFLWTLDSTKMIPDDSPEIDLDLLHKMKLLVTLIETSLQFILQLANTVANQSASTAYYASVSGTIFDLICSLYRYYYHLVFMKRSLNELKDVSANEIKIMEDRFKIIRYFQVDIILSRIFIVISCF